MARGRGCGRCQWLHRGRRWWLEAWSNDKWKQNAGDKGCNCKEEKCKGADACGLLPELVDFFGIHVRVLLEEWLRVDAANPGCDVKEEREPPEPCRKLNSTYIRDLGRQAPHSVVERLEQCKHTVALIGRLAVKPRISLANGANADTAGE